MKADPLADAIQYLRSLPLSKISPEYLSEVVIPTCGLGEIERFVPPRLKPQCGTGVYLQQMPIQFGPYLYHLFRSRVSTYLEIGAAHGGSFILTSEVLSKQGNVDATIINLTPQSPILKRYQEEFGAKFNFLQLNSQSDEAKAYISKQTWDAILLDGDHTYDGVMKDYNLVRNSARIVAIHDVSNNACPGATQAWQEIVGSLPKNSVHAFTQQYEETWEHKVYPGMGIGTITVRNEY